jgi:four helix bundle protein
MWVQGFKGCGVQRFWVNRNHGLVSSDGKTAEGFDSETNPEFVGFLRYAKRSCTEVQSELYVALVQQYITNSAN